MGKKNPEEQKKWSLEKKNRQKKHGRAKKMELRKKNREKARKKCNFVILLIVIKIG